ncbi:Transcriptional regulator prz1 [Lachnellula suecica]|uniref:Transcriptional regulator prz1 n=1 Tax=Lachnellula suecica TaxID=602035 RepID=A0A8T9BWV2_9HELO|nr:Transcriptional regulator prz1 [Lachnellula suecica]
MVSISSHLYDMIGALDDEASFAAENHTPDPGFEHDLHQAAYPTPEPTQGIFENNGSQPPPQDSEFPEYGVCDVTRDPPMSFRHRHKFLHGTYNAYLDPDSISGKDICDVARKAGLLMEEVLLWFEDEKSRRAELLAKNQHHVAQQTTCQFPLSPESTRTSGESSSASSPYNDTSAGTSSQSMDMFGPRLASTEQSMLAPPKPKRGRPAKTYVKTEPDSSSPESKRKKVSVKYPCPDCGNSVAAERWAEHFDRKHFPKNVWECHKMNKRTGKPCSSNPSPSYKPFYRHDNYETHLKGEHHCTASEVAELTSSCKSEVINFFHHVCGFCEKSLDTREKSIDHLKEHFRAVSQSANPPEDLGVSSWKEKCGCEHKLTLGVHYRRSQPSNPDPTDKDEDHQDHQDGNDDGGVGPGEGNSDKPGDNDSDPRPGNGNQEQDGGSGHDAFSSTSGSQQQRGSCNARTRQPRKLTTREDANFQCQVKGCGKSFGRSYNFKAHMETHDTSQNYQFPCPIKECHKRFSRKTDLERHHQSVHKKEKTFRCEHCDRCFAQEDILKRHTGEGCSKASGNDASRKIKIDQIAEPMLFTHMGGDNGEQDFLLYPDPSSFPFFETKDLFPAATGSNPKNPYAEAISYTSDSPEFLEAPSLYSGTSGPSAKSTSMGSPHSVAGHTVPVSEWCPQGLGLNPSIMGYDNHYPISEYNFVPSDMEDFDKTFSTGKPDPSIMEQAYPSILLQYTTQPPSAYPASLAPAEMTKSERQTKQGRQSPYLSYQDYPYPPPRRPSVTSHHSHGSQDGYFSGEESKEKGRCIYPECGKLFKDLKAHMLTHQNERPEKCPIQTCDYHIKGFARKYDKNRHTLTHYKGIMVCGFCPGSGSAAEKSFNRADVFKRHLTSVHGVEQTPPNSRKKTSGRSSSGKKLSGYAPDATGKCSTCTATFSNAQDFYEHLDDCVLRIVQQEEPSEVMKAARLSEAENDHGATEMSSVISFDGNESSSSAELSTFDGKRIKTRTRFRFTEADKAKTAVIRQLDSCSVCRSRRVKCALEHHDVQTVEKLQHADSNSEKNHSRDQIPENDLLKASERDLLDKDSESPTADDGPRSGELPSVESRSLRPRQSRRPSRYCDSPLESSIESKYDMKPTEATLTDIIDHDDGFHFQMESSSQKASNGVQQRGLTHLKGGVTLNTKGRKKRKDYPSSWGSPTSGSTKLKKRVVCAFDGPRRLWKGDLMLDIDPKSETLPDDDVLHQMKPYVTDLSGRTLRRAGAFFGATDEEKGPWVADDLTGVDLEMLLEIKEDDLASPRLREGLGSGIAA